MSRLITGRMSRYARAGAQTSCPDTPPGRHDGCRSLNDEDGEQEMSWDGRATRGGNERAPAFRG